MLIKRTRIKNIFFNRINAPFYFDTKQLKSYHQAFEKTRIIRKDHDSGSILSAEEDALRKTVTKCQKNNQ